MPAERIVHQSRKRSRNCEFAKILSQTIEVNGKRKLRTLTQCTYAQYCNAKQYPSFADCAEKDNQRASLHFNQAETEISQRCDVLSRRRRGR